MVIFLCGFMGAGKSTLLRVVERGGPPGWRFIDTDQVIGRPGEFIRRRGLAAFREREREVVGDCLRESHALVALGGGALEDPDNLRDILAGGFLVHLDTPLSLCLKRIAGEGALETALHAPDHEGALETSQQTTTAAPWVGGELSRPLAAGGAELYRRRLPAYRRAIVTLDPEQAAGVKDFADFMGLLKGAPCDRPDSRGIL